MLSKSNQQLLLNLARKSIEHYLDTGTKLIEIENEINDELREKKGTFVTLTIDNKLRGCIGHILPVQEIWRDIIDNAYSAAFQDSRFIPVFKHEFDKIKVEISILSIPEKLEYSDSDDLIKKLQNKPGLIIKHGFNSATFLPQVWDEIDSAEEFLSHLCQKAGLTWDFWQSGKLKVEIYTVDKFGEN